MPASILVQDPPTGGEWITYSPVKTATTPCRQVLDDSIKEVKRHRTGYVSFREKADYISGSSEAQPVCQYLIPYGSATQVTGSGNLVAGMITTFYPQRYVFEQTVQSFAKLHDFLDFQFRASIEPGNSFCIILPDFSDLGERVLFSIRTDFSQDDASVPSIIADLDDEPGILSSRPADQAGKPAPRRESTPARRIRELSGLEQGRLAQVFGVSRVTFHKWISGTSARGKHREQLLEALPLIEEANQRLGGDSATATWLLTPVSPGGSKPIDLLASRRYYAFRGSLLRTPTGRETARQPAPSGLKRVSLPREEMRRRLQRINPPPLKEDLELHAIDAKADDPESYLDDVRRQ